MIYSETLRVLAVGYYFETNEGYNALFLAGI